MEYRRLGSSGLMVSSLSLGSWVTYGDRVGEEVARERMVATFDAGVNFFSCGPESGELEVHPPAGVSVLGYDLKFFRDGGMPLA